MVTWAVVCEKDPDRTGVRMRSVLPFTCFPTGAVKSRTCQIGVFDCEHGRHESMQRRLFSWGGGGEKKGGGGGGEAEHHYYAHYGRSYGQGSGARCGVWRTSLTVQLS